MPLNFSLIHSDLQSIGMGFSGLKNKYGAFTTEYEKK